MKTRSASSPKRLFYLAISLMLSGLLGSCGDLLPERPVPAAGVEAYERITLGGVSQAIQIRGNRKDLPVLLFLHGGPGIPEMPVSRIYGGLEKDFIVVHWDQRGSGLSFDPAIPKSAMKVDQFVADTLELTHHLQARFHQRKIFLVGFSFGSEIAILAARKEPASYRAYIGISQFLDLQKSEEILDREGRERAVRSGDMKTLRKLEKIGPPPYNDYHKEGEVNQLTFAQVSRNMPHHMSTLKYLSLVPGAKAYRFSDLVPAYRGRRFVFKSVEDELYHRDISPQVRKLDVPSYFLLGRWDTVLSTTLIQHFEKSLIAPQGKSIHWFEHSGHAPHLEEPEEFIKVMREIKYRENIAG